MKEALIVDVQGFIVDVVTVSVEDHGFTELYEEDALIGYQVAIRCPEGFYTPKFDTTSETWVEGKSQEEIDSIKNTPEPETDAQKLIRLETENTLLRTESDQAKERYATQQGDINYIFEVFANNNLG
jgi:hypothetical protein